MSVSSLLARADRELEGARLLQERGFPEACVSRAYYAMFYAAEAMLRHQGHATTTHRGLHVLFARHLVKPGSVPRRFGQMLSRAYQKRQVADYADDFVILPAEAVSVTAEAEAFVALAQTFCSAARH